MNLINLDLICAVTELKKCCYFKIIKVFKMHKLNESCMFGQFCLTSCLALKMR